MIKRYIIILILLFSNIFYSLQIEGYSNTSNYVITSKDRVIINKVGNKLGRIIKKKGQSYKKKLESKISQIISSKKYSNKLNTILGVILFDLQNKKTNNIQSNKNSKQAYSGNKLNNIDIQKVRKYWLGLYNNVRENIGKPLYSYDTKLDQTALEWSKVSKKRGNISHKRNTNDSYYDYKIITSWFKNRGVVCKNIYRATHTENIGYGSYYCNKTDCTDELKKGIKRTFDFYMSEKGKSYDAHYRSIVHKHFTKIGLGIELEKTGNNYYKFYLTTHYCTELL